MTTANNIQMATLKEANGDIKEAGKMTNENDIHGPKSLVSNFMRTNRAILAGLLIGGMIAAASVLPGNASADTPARPVGDPEAAAKITHTFDMDLLDPGFYDARVIRASNSAHGFDMDLLDPGFYDAKVIRSSSTAHSFDIDLLDPGFYDAKLVRTSSVWQSPGFDPYEDVAAKLVRSSSTANVIDMDLLDPGFYDAKVIRTSSTANVIDMDLLDPGFYDAKLVRTSPSWEGLQDDNII